MTQYKFRTGERERLVIHRRLRNNPKDSRDGGGGVLLIFLFIVRSSRVTEVGKFACLQGF